MEKSTNQIIKVITQCFYISITDYILFNLYRSENIASRDSEEVSSGKKKLKGKRRTSNEVSREKQLLADLSTSSLETLLSRARSTKKAQICSRK